MEISFSQLRCKEVVNTTDGRKLGKICDIVFCYPENKILGFVVPGNRSLGSRKTDFFIDLKNVVKIGGDVVLVNVGCSKSASTGCSPSRNACSPSRPSGFEERGNERRSYEDYE